MPDDIPTSWLETETISSYKKEFEATVSDVADYNNLLAHVSLSLACVQALASLVTLVWVCGVRRRFELFIVL